jgi:hypothetical protein
MIGLRPATEEDKLHLAKMFSRDQWHVKEHVEDWLSVEITTFFDAQGPVFFMAFTDEGKTLRLHSQFNVMEKYRTAKAIPQVLDIIKGVALENGYTRLVFWSESPSMIAFMEKLKFRKQGEDWVLPLEVQFATLGTERSTDKHC